MSVLAMALAGTLAACGDDSDTAVDAGTSPSSSSSAASPSEPATTDSTAPSGPRCAAVWKDGATLPATYKGCVDDGQYVAKDTLGCSSGQGMIRYGDHFYAVLHGQIHETESVLDKDRGYRAAVAICRG